MIELILLLGLAWMLRNWLQAPTQQDCEDWIVMDAFDHEPDDGIEQMLVLIPESLLGERDTDSMRIVSKLLCLQLNLANIERAGLAREAKKTKQRPPVFLKQNPTKREVFGPFRGVSKKMWMKWFGWDYKKVVDKLVYKKIVERNDRYKVDGFPKSYRLAEEYWDEKLILRDITIMTAAESYDTVTFQLPVRLTVMLKIITVHINKSINARNPT